MKEDQHELAVWKLSDDKWRSLLKSRIADIADERNRTLNTPKTENIRQLFEEAVGLGKVPKSWSWKGMSAKKAGEKLDSLVALRGDIAHRSKAAEKIKKTTAKDFMEHVSRLVERTDGAVNEALEGACGTPLF